MHMKRLHLLKIRSAVTTLCVAVLLYACSNEIGTGGGEDGEFTTVTLSVGPTGNKQAIIGKALTDTEENAINTLYILAFQPDKNDGNIYKLAYKAVGKTAATGSSGSGKKFSFSLRRSLSGQADTKLFLVANYNPFPQANAGMTYEGVQAALISRELGTAPAFADTGIPMFGFAGNSPDTPLEITDGMALTANLLRAVARVDVGVGTYNGLTDTWDRAGVNFDLTEVYVFKPQNQYSLLPGISNLQYNMEIPSVTLPSPAGVSSTSNFQYTGTAITNNTYCKTEIYIPEVAFNGGTVYDGNHGNRTALVIGGTYNGGTNYYRIDFTTTPTNVEGVSLNDILRNYIYRYSITNVSLPGYDTPEKAYSGKPVQLSFTASVTDWVPGATGSPEADMLVRMNFNGINGTIKTGTIQEGGQQKEVTVKKKTNGFITDGRLVKAMLNYNNLRREAIDNTFNGTGNGGLYTGVEDAFDREGPYAKLVLAPDNAGDAVAWKTGSSIGGDRVLVAKKACWDYRGQGRSDWRLPRLSELYLLWLNRVAINQSKGFTSLGDANVTYWSATEGGNQDEAYAVDAAGQISLNAKSREFQVRCVREVQ